jgi:hypothetical protein
MSATLHATFVGMTSTSDRDEPVHGQLGVLLDDGERVQCHACGEWFLHLGSHAFHSHGLRADDYRRTYGLMQKTKLGGPAWLEMRRKKAADHLRSLESPRREQVKSMSTEERRSEQAKVERRREHELNRTELERIRGALRAKYGTEHGHPDQFIRHVAELFVDELRMGQRGVFRRLGDRMGTTGRQRGRG